MNKEKEVGGLVSLSIHRFASIRNLRGASLIFFGGHPRPHDWYRFIKIKGRFFSGTLKPPTPQKPRITSLKTNMSPKKGLFQ